MNSFSLLFSTIRTYKYFQYKDLNIKKNSLKRNLFILEENYVFWMFYAIAQNFLQEYNKH
jgi:hypothetical protein